MEQVTTLTFFSFKINKIWAFKQMGFVPSLMRNTKGLQFFKFLGTGGKEGFSLKPDFSTYAFLGVWDNLSTYKNCIESHPVFIGYKEKAIIQRDLVLSPIKSHGLWSGQNPFSNNAINSEQKSSNYKAVVITRATLHWNRLFSFWKSVPIASKAIKEAEGVIYYKGIGEWPFVQQATVSIWKDFESVNDFAYRDKRHSNIIKKTKQKEWYKEDLFARFYLISEKTKILN
ncbi:MAG: hypothetical protein ACJ0PR_05000 [Flavobacteriaceae bacterium]|tara:strand:+ start:403 stop:1089 length:687 start_codon:yes stop_codon:yes gene_type:complete